MERLGLPFLIPVGSIVGTFLMIFIISRILLFAHEAKVAVPLAMIIATLILIGAAVVASTGSSGHTTRSQRRRR
ncbi:MAG: hypothetical protein EXR50_00370 [Dehalococcoidia bacterium]|nr:hypothetical protein [Dehalococcoidia bacterium]